MSGSDSDLDYQSADDDADFDTHPNIKDLTALEQCDSKELPPMVEPAKQENVENSIRDNTPIHVEEQSLNKLSLNEESDFVEKENLTSGLLDNISDNSKSDVSSKTPEHRTVKRSSENDKNKDETDILTDHAEKTYDDLESKPAIVSDSNELEDSFSDLTKEEYPSKPGKTQLSHTSKESSCGSKELANFSLEEPFYALKEQPTASKETSQKSTFKVYEKEPPHENQRVVLRLEKLINQKQQKSKDVSPAREKPSDFINILQEQPKVQQSSWGFSSWGSSLLSSAASSVSTFSSQVSQGIGTVLETVESSLGAPGPEELAKALKEKRKEKAVLSGTSDNETGDDSESKQDQDDSKLGLLPDVSYFTKVIENTGSKVIMGGLDTLEFIGKKTMTILTEGDPGLRSKRSMFADGVNLSEILREAKTRAEQEQEDNPDDSDSIYYGQVFDDKQGLVHLEALEILSKQSQAKFQRLLMRHSKKVEVKKKLEEIKSICENLPSFDDPVESEQFDDFETIFKKHSIELSIPLNIESIIKTQRQIHNTICTFESSPDDSRSTPKEIFKSAISSLAEFTAKSIETFHKIAELILVQPNTSKDIELCATNLTGLTTVMCIEINNLSARYHKCLDLSNKHFEENASSESVDTTALATNMYVEAANSNNYIQDAYQMIVPILQVWILEALDEN